MDRTGKPMSKGRSKTPPPPPPSPALVPLQNTPAFKEATLLVNELSASWSRVLHVMIPKTLVYSPFYIRSLVSMARLGAAGDTAEEISVGLKIPTDLEFFSRSLEKMESNFKKFNSEERASYFLETRSFYIEKGFRILPEFQNRFMSHFPGANFHGIEFGDPVLAAGAINSWFSKETGDKIQNVVEPRWMTPFTRMLLILAIYFRGNWKTPFLLRSTSKKLFHVNSKLSLEVDMMNRSGKFLAVDLPLIEAQAVAIPHQGGSLYFVIFLPKIGTSLDKLRIRGLPTPILKIMKEKSINLSLPRFSVHSNVHLLPLLRRIGIKSMFNPNLADFSEIVGYEGSGLFVSDIIQSVRIEVNEGVAVSALPDSGTPEPAPKRPRVGVPHKKEVPEPKLRAAESRGNSGFQPLVIDRPFIFQVIHKETNAILIDGTCTNPTKAS